YFFIELFVRHWLHRQGKMRLKFRDEQRMKILVAIDYEQTFHWFLVDNLLESFTQIAARKTVFRRLRQKSAQQRIDAARIDHRPSSGVGAGHAHAAALPHIEQTDVGQMIVSGGDGAVMNAQTLRQRAYARKLVFFLENSRSYLQPDLLYELISHRHLAVFIDCYLH